VSFFQDAPDGQVRWGRIVALSLSIIVIPVCTWIAVAPQYRLWKAGIERQIQVRDAESKAKAAVQLAQAEVNRAKGVAEANRIIAHSITPEYLRYFYIQQLAQVEHLGGKIIYVPTEAGLPILEANRLEGDQP
jgi:regulator of protease activity HflC (stomatin/prohibitin superfamily)